MEELLKDFLAETSEQLEAIGAQLVRFEREPSDARILANVFRVVHAIKGTSGFLSLPRLERLAHASETLIEGLRDEASPSQAHVSMVLAAMDRIKFILGEIAVDLGEPTGDDGALLAEMAAFGPRGEIKRIGAAPEWGGVLAEGAPPVERRTDTIRISVRTLEDMTALVQELTLARNQLGEAAQLEKNPALREAVRRLSEVSAQLRVSVFAARMQPIERLFANLHRVVRDLAAELGRKVDFRVEGGGVELDRELIEAIRDPLTQLIRNAVGHGIESPQERHGAGKSEIGTIRVTARREAADVSIVVSDDGRGIDADLVRARAVAMGLGAPERIEALDDHEALRLVFLPSFSTAHHVSTLSGRGIGLDIVRTNLEAVGGSIELESRPGDGLDVSMRVPLTLAVTPALVLTCGGERYLVAQHHVEAIEAVGDGAAIEAMPDALRWRAGGASVPAVRLRQVLGLAGAPKPPHEAALRVRAGAHRYVLIVDDVEEAQETVFKQLPAGVPLPPYFIGAAILNDGAVLLALDPPTIGELAGIDHRVSANVRAAPSLAGAKRAMRLLTFRTDSRAWRAVPLQAVSLIAMARSDEFETADGFMMLRRPGHVVPIVDFPAGASRAVTPVIVLREGAERVGLAALEIGDVVEGDFELEFAGQGQGVLGVVNLDRGLAEIVDLFQVMDLGPRRTGASAKLSGRPEVLLLDPAMLARETSARGLRAMGARVSAFADEVAARESMANGPDFEAILVSRDMLESRATEVVRALRAWGLRRRAPMFVLASDPTDAMEAEADTMGFAGVIDRFDRSAIHAALSRSDARLLRGDAA